MNQAQEQRLEEIFRKNDNKGIAIAITGSWGIGKTFFWKDFLARQLSQERTFRNEKIFNRKYAYVSLFGLESLSDLKTQIYSNIENNHSSMEVPKWLKGLPAIFKDTRINQLGISAPAKLIDTLMFSQVKDAIICFDDFERMSNKLDIKDVMGLANQLKLEKYCQIVLILDETKTEDKNKEKYAEYKEKLIDETIKITSVEPLIRANTKGIDESLVDLMVKFAEELEIHNFRFFQKVIKLYRIFVEQLPEEIAESTKENILLRILQGYFIEDFGVAREISWADCRYIHEERKKEWSDVKLKNYAMLRQSFPNPFIRMDEWGGKLKKWFEQSDDWDLDGIKALANSEQISEKNNEIKDNFNQLLHDFLGLQARESFPQDLYEITQKVIGLENLGMISFAIKVLEIFGHIDKVKDLERLTCGWIREQILKKRRSFVGVNHLGDIRPAFNDCIEKLELSSENLPVLIDAVFKIYINGAWSNEDKLSVENATKKEWKDLLFRKIPQDERFSTININSSYVVNKILEKPLISNFEVTFRKMVIEIYEEKGKESEFHKKYMDYLIIRLEN
ncbi:KAP family P-loop domain protein [Acinetobacter cumulans]|uniref:P-loop NTPase fold protein n=1 Tax=Acinetobacter cumulans TaxID=2136182 RepID=UPI000D11937E|nr:P-loop NTPase fold protein [Acinetobacter cumulans]QCO20931.1 KAP family P-loop domain protein [Acinetobacter cumulans]